MFVEEIMTRNVATIDSCENVLEAYKKYRNLKIGSLIITDKDNYIGIVTERDLIERTINIDPKITKIKDIMSSDVKTIRPLEKIEKAVEIMEKKVIQIPFEVIAEMPPHLKNSPRFAFPFQGFFKMQPGQG